MTGYDYLRDPDAIYRLSFELIRREVDLSHLPPTLILAGANDMLTPDAVRFAARARQAGAEVEIDVEPGMIHVWPLMPIPEARRARERIARYLDGHWS